MFFKSYQYKHHSTHVYKLMSFISCDLYFQIDLSIMKNTAKNKMQNVSKLAFCTRAQICLIKQFNNVKEKKIRSRSVK